jgi:hypothetical protein
MKIQIFFKIVILGGFYNKRNKRGLGDRDIKHFRGQFEVGKVPELGTKQ